MIAQAVPQINKVVVDTVKFFDTTRVVVSETTHVRIVDTLGAVLPTANSTWGTAINVLISALMLITSIAAAIAAFRSAQSSRSSARTAHDSLEAARNQAASAEAQTRLLGEQIEASKQFFQNQVQKDASSLLHLAKRIRVSILALNEDGPRHQQFAGFSLVTERDVERLAELAASVSLAAIHLAANASVPIRAVLGFVEKAKSIHEKTGWIPTESEQANWKTARHALQRILAELEEMASAKAGG